jgi:hypothetical protein
MIKFKGKFNGKEILGMGISEANVRKLKEGMPILIEEPKFFNGTIMLMYGRTEMDIVEEIKPILVSNIKMYTNLGKD